MDAFATDLVVTDLVVTDVVVTDASLTFASKTMRQNRCYLIARLQNDSETRLPAHHSLVSVRGFVQ